MAAAAAAAAAVVAARVAGARGLLEHPARAVGDPLWRLVGDVRDDVRLECRVLLLLLLAEVAQKQKIKWSGTSGCSCSAASYSAVDASTTASATFGPVAAGRTFMLAPTVRRGAAAPEDSDAAGAAPLPLAVASDRIPKREATPSTAVSSAFGAAFVGAGAGAGGAGAGAGAGVGASGDGDDTAAAAAAAAVGGHEMARVRPSSAEPRRSDVGAVAEATSLFRLGISERRPPGDLSTSVLK